MTTLQEYINESKVDTIKIDIDALVDACPVDEAKKKFAKELSELSSLGYTIVREKPFCKRGANYPDLYVYIFSKGGKTTDLAMTCLNQDKSRGGWQVVTYTNKRSNITLGKDYDGYEDVYFKITDGGTWGAKSSKKSFNHQEFVYDRFEFIWFEDVPETEIYKKAKWVTKAYYWDKSFDSKRSIYNVESFFSK